SQPAAGNLQIFSQSGGNLNVNLQLITATSSQKSRFREKVFSSGGDFHEPVACDERWAKHDEAERFQSVHRNRDRGGKDWDAGKPGNLAVDLGELTGAAKLIHGFQNMAIESIQRGDRRRRHGTAL